MLRVWKKLAHLETLSGHLSQFWVTLRECISVLTYMPSMSVVPVKSLIRNGVISGLGCQVRVRCMRRVWCAVVGEGVGRNGKYYRCRMGEWSSSRIVVNMDMSTKAIKWNINWPNGKQKSQNKKPFEDVRHYLKYAEYPDSYFRQSGKKTSLRKYCRHFRYDTEGKTTITLIITYLSYSCCEIGIAVTSCKVVPNFTTVR